MYTAGPPEHFTLTASPPRVVPRRNATLKCEVKGMGQRHLNSYYWHWRFNEKEIKENERYKMIFNHLPPNFCQQSKGWATLEIMNISEDDFGQYECALQLSNITLAEKDIPVYDVGKHIMRIFNLSIFVIISHLASPHFNLPHLSSTLPHQLNSLPYLTFYHLSPLELQISHPHIPPFALLHLISPHFTPLHPNSTHLNHLHNLDLEPHPTSVHLSSPYPILLHAPHLTPHLNSPYPSRTQFTSHLLSPQLS